MSDDESRFCPHCDVSLDLHPEQDPDEMTPADCDVAGLKADLLGRWPL